MNQLRFSGIRDNKKRGSVSDFLKEFIQPKSKLSFVSAFFTIYAYHKMKENLDEIDELRFLFGEPRFIRSLDPEKTDKKAFNIEDNVLSLSNRLEQSRIARECESWIREKVQIRSIRKPNFLHGKMYHIRERGGLTHCITGSSNFTVNGLGLNEIPNIELNLITNDNRDIQDLLNWFNEIWESEHVEDVKGEVIEYLKQLYLDYSPEFIYYKTLYHIFQKYLQDKANLDLLENKTHFFDTLIWNKLFEFQKDGVKSAINKIEEYNGCIIADSVGLGKTFEALAVIKYFELRNDRVLVLCPKKLRNNWTVYQATNQTSLNPFIDDKFGYMVLNHTDLRDEGRQGDVDLSSVLWGNFDLVVIDESHNFRNNTKGKRDEEGNTIRKSRYEKLMQDIIQSGKNTKVLLLTATPVNVNLGDLKNQLYFLSAGDDYKYSESIGIDSIHRTLTNSQKIFTLWADPKNTNRKTEDLIEKLPPGFFKLLDELTIARSRKHIIKYYKANLEKIGSFPKRKKPISINTKIDLNDRFMSYDKIYKEISEYRLSLFTPFTFLKTEMIPEYEKKVSPRMVKNFTQEKREYFLAGMMKVNFMKRLESSIHSFRITIDRTIRKIDKLIQDLEDYLINAKNRDYEIENATQEEESGEEENDAFQVGEKLVYKFDDINVEDWLQSLKEDKDQLITLYNSSESISAERDAKLAKLKELIINKIQNPSVTKEGRVNKKVLIFTAFSDTATYLYKNLYKTIKDEYNANIALVIGSGSNHTTLGKSKYDDILINFSPISKNRDKMKGMPEEEIDILIATDCISEGQNLQDCDTLINYDIHWNPVRVIQRFGRIDRIGSKNKAVHLINFWPTKELDNYIKLKHRVEARMALVDISATNEDNILNIEEIEDMVTEDLSYRDEQLRRMQKEILDFDDLQDNISFSDFTLDDFRIDLLNFLQENEKKLRDTPMGLYSLVPGEVQLKDSGSIQTLPPGVIFVYDKQTLQTNRIQ